MKKEKVTLEVGTQDLSQLKTKPKLLCDNVTMLFPLKAKLYQQGNNVFLYLSEKNPYYSFKLKKGMSGIKMTANISDIKKNKLSFERKKSSIKSGNSDNN